MTRTVAILGFLIAVAQAVAPAAALADIRVVRCLYDSGEKMGDFVIDTDTPRVVNIYYHDYPITKHDENFITFRVEATNPAPIHLASYVAIHLPSGKFVQSRIFAACGDNDCDTNYALRPSTLNGLCQAPELWPRVSPPGDIPRR